jgi:hypothetical protein
MTRRISRAGRTSKWLAAAFLAATSAWTVPAALAQEADPPMLSDAAATVSRVRGMKRNGADASRLVAQALRDSETVRSLVRQLEATDVIVQVELRSGTHTKTGFLRFVGATANSRYLLITIETRLLHRDRIKWLGHELYHALEVATHPEVRDQASYHALYQRIGRRTQSGGIETDGAVAAGEAVYAELISRSRTRK